MKFLKLLLSSLILTVFIVSLAEAETRAQIEARERARTEELNNQQLQKATAQTDEEKQRKKYDAAMRETKNNGTGDPQAVAAPQSVETSEAVYSDSTGKYEGKPPGCPLCDMQGASSVGLNDATKASGSTGTPSSTQRPDAQTRGQ